MRSPKARVNPTVSIAFTIFQSLVADYLAKVSIHDVADPQGLKHRLALPHDGAPQGDGLNARH